MPAKKHRKGIAVSVYLTPERLDALGIPENSTEKKRAIEAIFAAIDCGLSAVEREYVCEAARMNNMTMPEWCRHMLVSVSRRHLGLPDQPHEGAPHGEEATEGPAKCHPAAPASGKPAGPLAV